MRGLSEELGIAAEAVQLAGPLASTHRRELHQGAFHDVELVQSYRWAVGWVAVMQCDVISALRGAMACSWCGPPSG